MSNQNNSDINDASKYISEARRKRTPDILPFARAPSDYKLVGPLSKKAKKVLKDPVGKDDPPGPAVKRTKSGLMRTTPKVKRKRVLKQFKELQTGLNEARTDSIVFTFGRFNPPTVGHEKLIDKVTSLAQGLAMPFRIFASKTQDKKKNPLNFKDKVKFLKKLFPRANFNEDPKIISPFHAMEALSKEGYRNLIFIVGADRVKEFEKKTDNIRKFGKFDSFRVISAGERDPDAVGVVGISASKLRNFAANNNLDAFKTGLPKNTSNTIAKTLFDAVRKGMGLKGDQTINESNTIQPNEFMQSEVDGTVYNVLKVINDQALCEVVEEGICGSDNVIERVSLDLLSPVGNYA